MHFTQSRTSLALWLALSLALCLLGSCAAPSVGAGSSALSEEPAPLEDADRLHQQLGWLIEEARQALAAGDDLVAERLLLRARHQADALALGGDSLESVQVLLDGFERVLQGRERVRALEGWVDVRRTPSGDLQAWLCLRSRWPQDLVLRAGSYALLWEGSTLNEWAEQVDQVRQRLGPDVREVAIPAGGAATVLLGGGRAAVPLGSLASRTRCGVVLRTPLLLEGAEAYPAETLSVREGVHVELANFLPAEGVSAATVLEAALDESCGIHALSERIARLRPAEYGAVRQGLQPLLSGRATDLEIQRRLAPILRWVEYGRTPGSDPAAWRAWAAAQSSQESRASLDLPRP